MSPVYTASDLDLYCMKLVSFRPKDIQDMIIIREGLIKKGITQEMLERNFIRLYGSLYMMKNDMRKIKFTEAQFG